MTRPVIAFATPLLLAVGGLLWITFPLQSEAVKPPAARPEFEGWPKPDVVLLISGQQYGYIEPCGCTGLTNQKGGLARRDALLQTLREGRGWDVIPLDAGNQVRRDGAQAAIKFQFTINALRQMKAAAVGLGPDDLRLTVTDLLAEIAASMDDQGRSDLFVCANANPLGFVATHRVIAAGGWRIGVTSVLGQQALAKVTQADIVTRPAAEGLQEAIQAMQAERCNVTICLAQADDAECEKLAKAVPGINLMVAAGGGGEPHYQPLRIEGTKTSLIQTGNKGMYVGAVGLFKNAKPALRYQRIPLDARFEDSKRMMESFAEYQQVLKIQGLDGLGLKPVQHVEGKFVGSAACGDCHTQAYMKFVNTPHHTATDSIAHPTERSTIPRHFDPECLSCHVTGWNPQDYFPYATGYLDFEKTPLMHGNGCENCHGPGQAHVSAESGEGSFSDSDISKLRQQMRLELSKAEQKCMECHDLDNSPDFHETGAFDTYWEAIAHPGKD